MIFKRNPMDDYPEHFIHFVSDDEADDLLSPLIEQPELTGVMATGMSQDGKSTALEVSNAGTDEVTVIMVPTPFAKRLLIEGDESAADRLKRVLNAHLN